MAGSQLLQRRGAGFGIVLLAALWTTSNAAGSHDPTKAAAKVALALQGGGFRAHTTDTGFLAGLLKFVGDQQALSEPTLSNTGLLSRFDTFATNSGSSWFFSELAYSPRFSKLLQGMAASPQTAGNQFNTGWFDPFKMATHVDPTKFNPLRDIAEWLVTKLLGKGDEDTIFGMMFILSTNSTWNEFVSLMLSSTASVENNMTLASPVESWCQGKYWLVAHTLVLPSEHHRAFMFTKNLNFSKLDFYQTTSYYVSASDNKSIPLLIPARFSMTLGEGPNFSAPFRYVSSTAVPNMDSFHYEGTVLPVIDKPTASYGPVDHIDFADKALTTNTGSLPIWGVATASSAFGGAATILGVFVDEVLAYFNHADLTPWVSIAPNGASFTTATALVDVMRRPFGVTKGSIDNLAAGAVHGVIDGGYSDGTALGTAVAAGAQEVLLVLNSAAECDAFFLDILMKDGPPPHDFLKPKVLYPLFETKASVVQAAWAAFPQLKLPNGTKFLKKLSAGTIHITTADNQYFGIKGGRKVTLHVVHACSDLDIGFLEKYVNFGYYSQEIILAINDADNKEFVNSILLPMVMGKGLNATVPTAVVI